MRALFLLISASLASSALAQTADEPAIVITGKPLAETKAALDACLARKCPPKEDIAVTIAHAENQFIGGDYTGARRTLGQSRGRNNRFAKTLPIEVSDLNRAYGRMSNVDGQPDSGRLAQIDSLDALKAGLDSDDTRIFAQRLMVADEFARVGRLRGAEDIYKKVAKQARQAGQLRVMGMAMLRDAVLHGAVASVNPDYRAAAERKIAKIENSPEPELADFRNAAKLLRAHLAVYENDPTKLDKAIAEIPPSSSGKPVLIYQPPLVSPQPLEGRNATTPTAAPQWIDLRYRVAADGTVHDIDILRDSGTISRDWPKDVLKTVAKRRYAPLIPPPGTDGMVRVERFSYVHDMMTTTGSRMAVRSIYGRITSLDITEDPPRG